MKILRFLVLLGLIADGSLAARGGGLASSAESAHPLAAGATAPDARVRASDGKVVSLHSILDGKPTILIFFRGGWCPFCNRHLAALGEHELDLRSLGFQIIALSGEGPAKLASTAEATHARYRLFSDDSAAAAIAYGVGYRLSPDTGRAYRENGIDLTPAPDHNGFWLPVPAAFIVDREGKIRFVYSNADPSVRVSAEELITAAKAAAK